MSTSNRWEALKQLLFEASQLQGETRSRFIADVPEELRDELESLVTALDDEGGRFEVAAPERMGSVGDVPSSEGQGDARVGERLGRYEIVRRVGQGGMGTVYEGARADEEFQKRVAIKVVRPELHSESAFTRFRQERQILADLDHPAIATLLDGGMTGGGSPYLVMEFVEGVPITEYCSRAELGIDDRVRLMKEVCEAVHVAHQNLIVHRDLKPANVLITEEGRPKLLDFGVAKLVSSEQGRLNADATISPERILTPAYSSPEQVRGGVVTTASDVYSLGVILYELLSERRPYDNESGSLIDMLDLVTTREPVKPSTAAETGQEGDRSLGRREHRKLTGDLDSIVLKAMRKEPQHRYASAHDLAADLGRYLAGRPVHARPATASYRIAKFVRRNRTPLVATALVVAAGGLGLVGTAIQAQRAAVAQARVIQRLEDVRELANSMLFEVHDAIADLPGATEARLLVLERGFENLETLADEIEDPSVQRELAEAYLRVGLVQGQPTGASLGDLDAARASYDRAIQIARTLVDASPDDMGVRRTLALSYEKLGDVLAWTGDIEGGVAHATTALGLYGDIAAAMPDSARHQFSVAISLVKLGDLSGHPAFPNLGMPDSSIIRYRDAVSILRSPPLSRGDDAGVRRYDGLTQERIGMIHRINGRFEESRAAFSESLATRIRLYDEAPGSAESHRDVAVTYQNLCEVERALGNLESAITLCRDALDAYETLHAADRSSAQGFSDVAVGALSLAGVLEETGQVGEGLRIYERSIEVLREAIANEPRNLPNRSNFARALGRHSVLARNVNRDAPYLSEAIDALEALRRDGYLEEGDEELLVMLTRP